MNENPVHDIRLLVVDDHALFREGLVRLLAAEAGFRVVAKCAHLAEALELLGREPIDCVLLDFDLDTEQGSHMVEEIRRRELPTRVLMVTAGMTRQGMLDLLNRGQRGSFSSAVSHLSLRRRFEG